VSTDHRRLLLDMFQAAVNAAAPDLCVPGRPTRPTIIVGDGKGDASMAAAVDTHWDGPLEGPVMTRHSHGVRCKQIEVVEASHPVPDEGIANTIASFWIASQMLDRLDEADISARLMRAIEKVAGAGIVTPGVGGTATAKDVTDAVVEIRSDV
jgi:hydroxypyruvate reductase